MSDTRIDCALGIELKTMRLARELSLMTMSEDLGWRPVKLSNYEHSIGALTDKDDARAIEDYLCKQAWDWCGDAIALSNKEVITDLSKTRAMLARWRDGDFGGIE